MGNNDDKGPDISRRGVLAGTGVAVLVASRPALAEPLRNGPPGHRRLAPRFRQVDLGK